MFSGVTPEYLAEIFIRLLKNVPITLFVVVVAAFFAFFLGIGVTVVRVKKVKILFPVVSVYVSFVRSTPVLIQLFVIYYGLPVLLQQVGIDINQLSRTTFAVVTLVLHNAAYFSEIVRPAYLAVEKGQHDAADSIGMTGFQKLWRIISPQVIPIALPTLANLFIDLIKDTSILFTIGIVDLMGGARIIIANNYGIGKIGVYIVVALLYWGVSALAEKGFRMIEAGSKYRSSGSAGGRGETKHA